jgi:hypothetical protein
MIIGISLEDRCKLLAAVAQRETASEAAGLETPQEVYNFQLSAAAEDNERVVVIVAVELVVIVAVEQTRQRRPRYKARRQTRA